MLVSSACFAQHYEVGGAIGSGFYRNGTIFGPGVSAEAGVRNRFAAGVSHTFNKHLTLEIYGMRQNDGRTKPGDVNVIGTTWRVKL